MFRHKYRHVVKGILTFCMLGLLTGCNTGGGSGAGDPGAEIDPNTVYEETVSLTELIREYEDRQAPGDAIPSNAGADVQDGGAAVVSSSGDGRETEEASDGRTGSEHENKADSTNGFMHSNDAQREIRIHSIASAGNKYCALYTVEYDWAHAGFCIFDGLGKEVRLIPLELSENAWGGNISASPDGKIFLMVSSYHQDTDSYLRELRAFSLPEDLDRLELLWSRELTGDENFYEEGIASTKEKTLLLVSKEAILLSNDTGEIEKRTPLPVDQFYGTICANEGGDFLLLGSGSSGSAGETGAGVWKYDPAAGAFSKETLAADGFYNYENASGGSGGYDFFVPKDDGVYGLKTGDAAPVKLVDFISSDLDIQYARRCAAVSPVNMVLLYNGHNGEEMGVLLNKVDAASVEDKQVLTLGCTYADSYTRKAIVDFNKNSKEYRVVLKTYPYDDEGGGGLNTALAAGQVPDMISITQDMPVESYAAKGLFEDIEPFFEEDPDISEGDYLENILDTFRIDGKMYFVTPGFNVIGLMGKRKDFGDAKGVTISQLEKMIDERGIGYDTALGVMTRDGVLAVSLYFAMDQYMDPDRGTCSFNSPGFIDLLEFARKFPEKINYETLDWEEYEANIRTGKQLVRDVYLYDYDSFMHERYGYFGEEVTFMGYPGNGENGPAVNVETMIAMSHAAQDKEACWEFLRTFYLEKYQTDLEFGFPVSRESLRKMAEKALNPEVHTYKDENGEIITEDSGSILYLKGQEIKIPAASQADIDEVMGILESAGGKPMFDTGISMIIQEEAGAFFAGQKSAEETAEIIQSRVKVYLQEVR